MKLTVLGSNSLGNCYILETSTEALIIEAGIRIKEVHKALKFNISKVVGAIISHEHNDHSGYIHNLMKDGITVLAPEEVFTSKEVSSLASFRKVVEPNKGYKVGGFKIIPLSVEHDVTCMSYIIDHADMGRMLFTTDTMIFPYIVPNLNHLLIEANYADDILECNIESGRMPIVMRKRLLMSHMELETTKQILQEQDLTNVSNIVLIHLSDGNSNEARFIKEITEVTGKSVYAANKGLVLDLSLNPY